MMNGHRNDRTRAFTLTELFIILAVIAVLAMLLVPGLFRARERARRISCTSNLKIIGMALKTWSMDHTNLYPMQVPLTNGGSREFLLSGAVFRHFQLMSNDLATPLILACPADRRRPARDFARLANSNISYFVTIEADDDHPQMVMAGDRNLTNGSPLMNGLLTLTTNRPLGWTHDLHNGCGQVLLSDGSVMQIGATFIRFGLQDSEGSRLAIP
jgi:competence protein ComGC